MCSSSDYQALQEDVDALADWISAHKLQFNCGKCKSMLVTRKREPTTPPTIKVNDLPLERVYSYKYLGILITSDLSWSAHVATICSKARQQIGLLYHRFYKYSNMDTLKLTVYSICASSSGICCPCLGPSPHQGHKCSRGCTEICLQSLHKKLGHELQ